MSTAKGWAGVDCGQPGELLAVGRPGGSHLPLSHSHQPLDQRRCVGKFDRGNRPDTGIASIGSKVPEAKPSGSCLQNVEQQAGPVVGLGARHAEGQPGESLVCLLLEKAAPRQLCRPRGVCRRAGGPLAARYGFHGRSFTPVVPAVGVIPAWPPPLD